MAAPRPDVKFYLDATDKAALDVFATYEGLTLGQLTERVMSEYLRKRVHDASVLAVKLQAAGIALNPTHPTAPIAGTGRK